MHSPLVKICGLTTPEDAVATAEAGADWIGLNFYPPSPRYVTPDAAAAIVRRLPPTVAPVGLFVDRSPAEVAEVAEEAGLRIVQLHGDEPPEMVAALGGLRVVKAFRLGDAQAVERMKAYLAETDRLGRPPEAVLVDAFLPGLPGGTGRSVADELLDLLPPLSRLILAGGLTPENVGERVARARPWMVDVAGGVESAPGRKDPARVAAFVRNAKGTR
jgi:phosphoribosylanthranilate isomerase